MKFRFRWTLGLAVIALLSFGLVAVACEDNDTDDPFNDFNGNGFDDGADDGMNGNGFDDGLDDGDGFGMHIDGVSGGGSAIITVNGPRLS